ncbi:MAG TPA: hypothetical protein VFD70_27945 [Anaerolineae bacterium]|nr:hypothetical protein [Anaerolineae bacterium]
MNNRSSLLSNPALLGIGGLVVGLLLGWLVLGSLFLSPFVRITDTDPWDLNSASKQEWVVMTADSYSNSQDLTTARERLRGFTPNEITQVLRAAFVERNTKGDAEGAARIAAFGQVLGINIGAGTAAPQPTPTTSNATRTGLLDSLGTLLLLLAVIILLIAAGLYIYMRMRSGAQTPRARAQPVPATAAATEYVAPSTENMVMSPPSPMREQPVTAPTMTAPAPVRTAPTTAAKSLGTFAATYKFGEDNYDTSFTLETARGEFLGETGMGSSETIGEGKPDKVTAFDIWLFDKTDVRTVTQILMSEAAFNDQATRQRLATKGELVLAEKGKHVRLETATLAVDAEIVDLVYASTPGLPPNSHFQKLIVEMVPSQK